METNVIVCGDSQKVLKLLSDQSIDFIVSSPNYNFGMNYDICDDSIEFKNYYSLLKNIFLENYRILKEDGRIAINVMPKWDKDSPTHHIITNICRELGFKWFGEIIWFKTFKHSTSWGSWASPSNPSMISNMIEFIELFYKGSKLKIGSKDAIDITGNEYKEWIKAVWEIPSVNGMQKKFNHPAIFPEEIPKRLMKLFSYKGDIVLDPFNGVGTTTKVAQDLRRRYIGIDISKEYCRTAMKRLRTNEGLLPFDTNYSKSKLLDDELKEII